MPSNRQKITLILFSVFVFLVASNCGASTTPTAPTTETFSPPAVTPTQLPPTPTPIPPTATPEPTATDIPPTSTPQPTATPQPTVLPSEIVDTHGVPMVLIPAGEFIMGADDDQAAAKPAHSVYLDDYYNPQVHIYA